MFCKACKSPPPTLDEDERARLVSSLDLLGIVAHANATQRGFWDGQDAHNPLVALAKINLIYSEMYEAVEAVRAGDPNSQKIPLYTSLEEELADTVIRIFDLATARGLELGSAIVTKHLYNLDRQPEHGKLL